MPNPPLSPRPRVLVNFASSIDGKINPAPGLRHGPFAMSRHHEDPDRMVALRARADAILIGASNLRADDPDLALSDAERARRRAGGLKEPARVVVTRRGEGLSAGMKIFDPARGGATVVVHTAGMATATRVALGGAARLVELGAEAVGMPALLAWLAAELGVGVLLCEGGGELCAQLFAARAVDQLYVTFVPRVLGGARAPTMVAGPGLRPDEVPDARIGAVEQIGDELFVRYEFDWS